MRPIVLLLLLVSGCSGPARSTPPPPQAGSRAGDTAVSEADARAIASRVGRDAGYDPAVFRVVSVTREEEEGPFKGTWRVTFEHVPPAPPGGHFTVYVNVVSGEARLFRGE